tara:strand:- start:39 stop:902 length:864 start_codon:yes stop_codon:yes gene_type:complete
MARNKSMKEQLEGIAISVAPIVSKEKKRESKQYGGIATAISKAVGKKLSKSKRKKLKDKQTAPTEEAAQELGEMTDTANQLRQRGFSDNRIEELLEEAYELGEPDDLIRALKKPLVREQKQEGGDVDSQMTVMMTKPMKSDEQMEDDFIDFVVTNALDNTEQKKLMDTLESDEEISVIFDKLMSTATEFAGSGPVEGPGSAVSDSIPARLSDGEFVFTTKAAEEIGADNLQRMMEDAEASAEERQNMQVGGEAEEEEKDMYGRSILESDKDEEINKAMLSVNPRTMG